MNSPTMCNTTTVRFAAAATTSTTPARDGASSEHATLRLLLPPERDPWERVVLERADLIEPVRPATNDRSSDVWAAVKTDGGDRIEPIALLWLRACKGDPAAAAYFMSRGRNWTILGGTVSLSAAFGLPASPWQVRLQIRNHFLRLAACKVPPELPNGGSPKVLAARLWPHFHRFKSRTYPALKKRGECLTGESLEALLFEAAEWCDGKLPGRRQLGNVMAD